MKLTKSKLKQIIREELDESILATTALAGLMSLSGLSGPFVNALNMVKKSEQNQISTFPKGVDADTVKALFTLKRNKQLGDVKALQRLDQRTRSELEVPDEFKK